MAALWQLTDALKISLNYLNQTIEADGRRHASVGKYEQTRWPIAPQGRVRGVPGENSDTEAELVSLVLNYDMSWAALTSAVSWVDGGSIYAGSGFAYPASSTLPSDFKSFTTETRLASQFDGPFQFLGGVFYENVDDRMIQTVDWPGTQATNPYTTNPGQYSDTLRKLDQRAVFGELSYDLTEKLTALVGARYFKYDKSSKGLQAGGAFGVPLDAGIYTILQNDQDGTSLKANLSYKLAEDSVLYASWSEGFRLGRPTAGLPPSTCDTDSDGFVDGTNLTIESTRTIDSDFLDNYEIGGKFTLFDRRMTIDASVYHIEWEGLPIRSSAAMPACGLSFTSNVGAAVSDGMELQARLYVMDGLRVDFGGAYTKPELSEDAPGLGARAGARLPGSPEVSFNFGAQYDFEVAGYDAFVRADSFYTGAFYGDLFETAGLEAGDYVKVDMRTGVAFDKLKVDFFVRNLTNEDAFTWRGLSGGVNPFFGYRMQPRTVGIQLSYSFQ